MMGWSIFFLFAAFAWAAIGRWDWFIGNILLSLIALWQAGLEKDWMRTRKRRNHAKNHLKNEGL